MPHTERHPSILLVQWSASIVKPAFRSACGQPETFAFVYFPLSSPLEILEPSVFGDGRELCCPAWTCVVWHGSWLPRLLWLPLKSARPESMTVWATSPSGPLPEALVWALGWGVPSLLLFSVKMTIQGSHVQKSSRTREFWRFFLKESLISCISMFSFSEVLEVFSAPYPVHPPEPSNGWELLLPFHGGEGP